MSDISGFQPEDSKVSGVTTSPDFPRASPSPNLAPAVGKGGPGLLSSASTPRTQTICKVPAKVIFTKINETKPSAISTTIKLLRSFIREETADKRKMFPREFYVVKQCVSTAQLLQRRALKWKLTFIDIREALSNLAYLRDHLEVLDPIAATRLCTFMVKMIHMLSDITTMIETLSKESVTNWGQVQNTFYKAGLSQQRYHLAIPKMEYFQFSKILGAGGFGAVFLVSIGDVFMACKCTKKDRFPSEAHACVDKIVGSMIHSTFLPKYYASFCTQTSYLTLMEYVRGVDLYHLIVDRSWLPEAVIKFVMIQMAAAIDHMHKRGFIHRDIKPSNIMILNGCKIKLIDFDTAKVGMSKFQPGFLRNFLRTIVEEFRHPELAGTPCFFAPETVLGKPYGKSIDWWSLGVTGFRLGTGRLPFRGYKSLHQMRTLIKGYCFRWPTKATHITPLFRSFIDRLLAREPKLRLCSDGVTELIQHPFFKGYPWEKLNTPQCLIDHKPLEKFLAPSKTVTGDTSPMNSMKAQTLQTRGFAGFETQTDTNEQTNLFVFSSVEMRQYIAKKQEGKDCRRIESDSRSTEPIFETNQTEAPYKFKGVYS